MTRVGSVLIVRLSSLGDVLFALPAAEALIRSPLVDRVAWLVEDRAATLLESIGLDEVVVFPRRRPSRWPAHARALAARRDDVVLDLQGNLKSRLQLAWLRCPRKVGYDSSIAKEGAEAALTERVSPPTHARHRVASALAIVRALGVEVPDPPPRPAFPLPDEARAAAAAILEAPRDAARGPVVVLSVGTSAFGAFKRWPAERFGRLAARLRTDLDARVLLSGGPGEHDLVATALTASRGGARPASTRSLHELAALLDAADIVVAADSLPLHLANLLGTATVGLYGPKSPAVTGPFFDGSEVVTARVACSPCTLRRCSDRICMDEIDVTRVAAAVRRGLDR